MARSGVGGGGERVLVLRVVAQAVVVVEWSHRPGGSVLGVIPGLPLSRCCVASRVGERTPVILLRWLQRHGMGVCLDHSNSRGYPYLG